MADADRSAMIAFGAVVLARLGLPLLVPYFPVPAIIGVLILDAADQSAYELLGTDDVEGYQTYDRALDIYYLTIAYAATIRNWAGGFAFDLGRALWYHRLIGVALFEYVGARWLLLLFPNAFEYYFVAIEAIKVERNPFALSRRQLAGMAAFIWIFIKLPQEWWLHIARLDLTDVIKEHLFGVPADSPWREAVEHRPVAVVMLLLAVAAVALAVRLAYRRLPPREWKPTLSTDAQARRLGWPVPRGEAVPSTFFGWPFVEKAALVSLVTMIFSQILPGRRNMLQVGIGATAVIAATTLISQWLARRGVTWRSIGTHLLLIGTINLGIGIAAGVLLSSPGTRTPPGTFLFLTALLTLIVVLFDRFKSIEGQRGRGRDSAAGA